MGECGPSIAGSIVRIVRVVRPFRSFESFGSFDVRVGSTFGSFDTTFGSVRVRALGGTDVEGPRPGGTTNGERSERRTVRTIRTTCPAPNDYSARSATTGSTRAARRAGRYAAAIATAPKHNTTNVSVRGSRGVI
jgi:hypothetical protein